MKKETTIEHLLKTQPHLQLRVQNLLGALENSGIEGTEEQLVILLNNMVNYFADKTDIFSSKESRTEEENERIDRELKKIALSIMESEFASTEELLQAVIFGLMSRITEMAKKKQEKLNLIVINEKQQDKYKKIMQESSIAEINKIHQAAKLRNPRALDKEINCIIKDGIKVMSFLDSKNTPPSTSSTPAKKKKKTNKTNKM